MTTVKATQRRRVSRATEGDYAGIDIARARELAAKLAESKSDSEAIATLRRSSVQVVHQDR